MLICIKALPVSVLCARIRPDCSETVLEVKEKLKASKAQSVISFAPGVAWLGAKDLATNEMYRTSEPATETSWRLGRST